MTDLEMTRLCAEAMGIDYFSGTEVVSIRYPRGDSDVYDPLQDDAQAMALVKRFTLRIDHNELDWWSACIDYGFTRPPDQGYSSDLNRAIVECVAKMQQAKP